MLPWYPQSVRRKVGQRITAKLALAASSIHRLFAASRCRRKAAPMIVVTLKVTAATDGERVVFGFFTGFTRNALEFAWIRWMRARTLKLNISVSTEIMAATGRS